jgi:hypothetical protein
MIVKDYGLADISFDKNKFIFTHAQDVDPTLAEIKALQDAGTDGFSADRTLRHIGRIPMIAYLKHPEWSHEPELLLRWLQSDEGKQYQVHKINTGRSGKVIVK